MRSHPGYSVFVNVLDYSACTIPVLEVDKAIDVVDQDFQPFTKSDQAVHDDCKYLNFHSAKQRDIQFHDLTTVTGGFESRTRTNMSHVAFMIDDPEIYHGASVGVQVIGRRLQEERVLALAELIGEAIARHNKT